MTDHTRSEETKHHHHRGKSSERLLDKSSILSNLGIVPGQVVLDAGCGNGYMAKAFGRLTGHAGKVYALDPDPIVINTLKAETPGTNIEAFVGDITAETELPAGSIDLIYLSTVIHGFSASQMAGFAAEARRLLKLGGKLAVVEFHKKDTPFGPPLDIRVSPEELRGKVDLHPAGLIEAGEYFYLQVFQK